MQNAKEAENVEEEEVIWMSRYSWDCAAGQHGSHRKRSHRDTRVTKIEDTSGGSEEDKADDQNHLNRTRRRDPKRG